MFQRSRFAAQGFTLFEVLTVAAIIGILASVVLVNLGEARAKANDVQRQADLKQLQLAIELYAQENGEYPPSGCTNADLWCTAGPNEFSGWQTTNGGPYIQGLVPMFVDSLPRDPRFFDTSNVGYVYRTWRDPQGRHVNYKLLSYKTVEFDKPQDNSHEFSRISITCTGLAHDPDSYGVYSPGAACF